MINEPGWVEILSFIFVLMALIYSVFAIIKRTKPLSIFRKNTLLLLNLISFFGLAGIVFQPAYVKDMDATEFKREVILLTQNSKNYQNAMKSETPVYTLEPKYEGSNVKLIRLPQQLLLRHPDLTHLTVFGDGLLASDWPDFKNIQVNYHKSSTEFSFDSDLTTGFIDVSWNKNLNIGEDLNFSARFQSQNDNLLKVVISDPAGDIASQMKVKAHEYFRLSAKPKLTGQHVYTIEVFNSKNELLAKEYINLQVLKKSLAKLLVLQSTPSFEIKRLQNWAGENGAEILIKSRISKDKYINQFINLPAMKNSQVSPELFNHFDMLIIDGRGFIELSQTEKTWLHSAVESGLGLLIIVDNELVESHQNKEIRFLSGIKFSKVESEEQVKVYWRNHMGELVAAGEDFVAKLPVEINLEKNQLSNAKRIAFSGSNELLIHQHGYGLGNVAVSLLSKSYQWVTSGNKHAHGQFWSSLIRENAKGRRSPQALPIKPDRLYFEGAMSEQCIYSEKDIAQLKLTFTKDPQVQQSLLLQKSPMSDFRYCGLFWPKKSGWYQVSIAEQAKSENDSKTESDLNWQYIEPANAWSAMQQFIKISNTLSRVNQNHNSVTKRAEESYQPLNQWIFWWLFFISASLIWLERKIS